MTCWWKIKIYLRGEKLLGCRSGARLGVSPLLLGRPEIYREKWARLLGILLNNVLVLVPFSWLLWYLDWPLTNVTDTQCDDYQHRQLSHVTSFPLLLKRFAPFRLVRNCQLSHSLQLFNKLFDLPFQHFALELPGTEACNETPLTTSSTYCDPGAWKMVLFVGTMVMVNLKAWLIFFGTS